MAALVMTRQASMCWPRKECINELSIQVGSRLVEPTKAHKFRPEVPTRTYSMTPQFGDYDKSGEGEHYRKLRDGASKSWLEKMMQMLC